MKMTNQRKKEVQNRTWLITYGTNRFHFKECVDKYGEVYFVQNKRFKVGDTGYLYANAPESAIRYSFEIIAADLPYDPIMDRENEFLGKNGHKNSDSKHKKFALFAITGETHNEKLKRTNLVFHGMKDANGHVTNMILSKDEYRELHLYIHENF